MPYIIFDGYDTSELFTVSEMNYNLLNKEVSTVEIVGGSGERVIGAKLTKNEFTTKIFFDYHQLRDLEIASEFELKRAIAEIFDTDEPKRFIYSKDPNVYMLVIFDGTSEIEFFADGTAETEVTFLVPDGLAHANEIKIFGITENLLQGTSDEWEEYNFSNWSATDTFKINLDETDLEVGDYITYRLEVDNTLDSDNKNEIRAVIHFRDASNNRTVQVGTNYVESGEVGYAELTTKIPDDTVSFTLTKATQSSTGTVKKVASRKHMLTKGKQPVEWTDERIFHIVNKGTRPARVNFDLQATRDLDSFALITGNGEEGQMIQIGDEDDPEITEKEPQTYLWKGKMNSKQEGNWQDNIATPNYFSNSSESDKQSKVQGSVNWSRDDGVRARDFGGWNDGDTGFWHGPSITRFYRQGVEDFILYSRFHFRVSPLSLKGKKRSEQGGMMEFNVRDNDDQLICGVHFRDNDNKKEVVWINVYLADVKVWDGKVPRAKLMQDKRFAGGLTIQRNGDKFYIEIIKNRNGKQHWKKTLSINNNAAAKLLATRVDYWFAQYGGRKTLAMDVTHSNFKILNTEDEASIPNHLEEDDEILIDGAESKVYINGAKRPEYFITGSKFIEVPPGETDIYVIDDGALIGTASIEEVYA